jgi:preprotein translocase subunit Sec63
MISADLRQRRPQVGGSPRRSQLDEPRPHEVLGVAEDASEDEVRHAYQQKMREYHPDKVANAAPELRELAERRSKEINAAYEAMNKR